MTILSTLKKSQPLSLEVILSFPVIFLALWQFLACSMAVVTSSFFAISASSFVEALVLSVVILRCYPSDGFHLSFKYGISFLALSALAVFQFMLVYNVQISDGFWPTAIIALVNQVIRGHFPVSFLSFPDFWANYHQGFIFLAGMLARWTGLDAVDALRILILVSVFYFAFLIQVVTAKFSRPEWAWLAVVLIYLVRSLEIYLPVFKPYAAVAVMSIPEYLEQNSWALSLCLLLVIFLITPKKTSEYTPARFFTQYLLVFTLLTANACLFAVGRIMLSGFLLVMMVPYCRKAVGMTRQMCSVACGAVLLMLLWGLPRFIPSAFLVGENYEAPIIGLQFVGKHPEILMPYSLYVLKHILMAGPIAIAALFLIYWCLITNAIQNIRQQPLVMMLAVAMGLSFLFPLVFTFANINWWDNLHKFTLVWMICSLVFISVFFSTLLHQSKAVTATLVIAVLLSLYGESVFHLPSENGSIYLSRLADGKGGLHQLAVGVEPYSPANEPYADVVSFLQNQEKMPLIYPYHQDLALYSPALFIASFSGSFLKNCFFTNFLLSSKIKSSFSHNMEWWKADRILSVAKESYDPTWILVQKSQFASFKKDVNAFNKTPESIQTKIVIADVHNFKEYVLAKLSVN